jgi:hypothetical protein
MINLSESQINMMIKQKTSRYVDNKYLNSFLNFWVYVFKKLIFAIISVKVLAFILIVYVCRSLLIDGFLNGTNFSSILICIIPAFFAAREYSKVAANTSFIENLKTNPVIEQITDTLSTDNTPEE